MAEASEPWTAGRVRARLVEAFTALPAIGPFHPLSDVLIPAEPGAGMTDLEFIAVTAKFLEERERAMLLTWARVKSQRKTARAVNKELRGILAELNWPKTTFYRRVDAAAASVARGLELRRTVDHALRRHFGVAPAAVKLDHFIADVWTSLRLAA